MTVYPTVRLDADGLDSLVIDQLGLIGQTLDLGDATTRAVVQDAPDADGTIDTTVHIGARNVTLALIAAPGTGLWSLMQQLRAFTHPRRRPVMTVQQAPDAPVQRLMLRRSQWSDPIGSDPRDGGSRTETQRTITVQWVAPLGILESDEIHYATAQGSGGVIVGRTYPLTFNRVYPTSAPSGQALIVNNGNTDAYPLIRLYGPAGNGSDEITIENRTVGKSIVFTGLTIPAGEFLEVDTRAKTALYLGNPLDNRYNLWNFTLSDWWALAPGENDIRYTPDTFSAPAAATLEYRSAWL